MALVVALGGVGSVGAQPGIAAGPAVHVGLRGHLVSIGLEARGEFRLGGAAATSGGHVETNLITGTVVPCVRREPIAVCALVVAGVLDARALDVASPRYVTGPWVALGTRVVLELPVTRIFAAWVHADLAAPLVRASLRVDDHEVWASWPSTTTLGVSAVARFW